MPSTHSSHRREPFVFSALNRYYIWTFFGLAFLGPLIDRSLGKDPLSNSSVTFGLGYPLAMVYFFWSAFDTLRWLRKRPDEFFKFARIESQKKMGGLLSTKARSTWFFSFYIVLTFVLGIFMSVATAKVITIWIK